MKKFFTALVIFTVIFSATSVFASNIFETYGNRGFLWMSAEKSYSGSIWVSSTNCNDSEVNAYQRVKNSTTGTTEMSLWKNGIDMSQKKCDGTLDNYIDIVLSYEDFDVTHDKGTFGGENHHTDAPKSYCDFWNATYPCGSHPATVHINLEKWNTKTTTWRERLIMHETGHSHGLDHHCTSDSIMNDGSSTCNGGKWTAIMSYQVTDRKGINSIYPQ